MLFDSYCEALLCLRYDFEYCYSEISYFIRNLAVLYQWRNLIKLSAAAKTLRMVCDEKSSVQVIHGPLKIRPMSSGFHGEHSRPPKSLSVTKLDYDQALRCASAALPKFGLIYSAVIVPSSMAFKTLWRQQNLHSQNSILE